MKKATRIWMIGLLLYERERESVRHSNYCIRKVPCKGEREELAVCLFSAAPLFTIL